MMSSRQRIISCLCILATGMLSLTAEVSLGYAFPGVVQPGSNVHLTLGGQELIDVKTIFASHPDVKIEVLAYSKMFDPKELRRLERRIAHTEIKLKNAKGEKERIQLEGTLKKAKFLYDHRWKMPEDKEMRSYLKKIVKKRQPNAQLEDMLNVSISVPDHVQGEYMELRAVGNKGLSRPLILGLSPHAPVSEVEPNDFFEDAMELATHPIQLNGQILPGDIDRFKILLKKGQTLNASLSARKLIPYLADAVPGWFQSVMTLYDEKGQMLICEDDNGSDPDPVLIYTSSKDQTVTLEVRDSIHRGREDFVYSIAITDAPFIQGVYPLGVQWGKKISLKLEGHNISQEEFQLDSTKLPIGFLDLRKWLPEGLSSTPRPLPFFVTKAQSLYFDELPLELTSLGIQGRRLRKLPATVDGHFGSGEEWKALTFKGEAGQQLHVDCLARRYGSPVDGEMRLISPKGEQIAMSDDIEDRKRGLETHHADPWLLETLPVSGAYTLLFRDLNQSRGERSTFRLVLGEPKPDVDVMVSPSRISLRRGGHTPLNIHLQRRHGYESKVRIHLEGAPKGCVLSGNVIEGEIVKAPMTLYWPFGENIESHSLKLRAEIETPEGWERRQVLPVEDTMQAFLNRHLVSAQDWRVTLGKGGLPLDWEKEGELLHLKRGEVVHLEVALSKRYKKKVKPENFRFSLNAEMEKVLKVESSPEISKKGGKVSLKLSCIAKEPGDFGNVLVEVKDARNPMRPKVVAYLPALPVSVLP